MSYSVLVVDDEFRNREMLRMMLEIMGYIVFEAEDGIDALAKVAENRPDVMILDVMMPNMDGITLCKQLRSQPETADLPIIMLSGKTHDSAIQEGLEAGANQYMKKPMAAQELLANVKALASRTPAIV